MDATSSITTQHSLNTTRALLSPAGTPSVTRPRVHDPNFRFNATCARRSVRSTGSHRHACARDQCEQGARSTQLHPSHTAIPVHVNLDALTPCFVALCNCRLWSTEQQQEEHRTWRTEDYNSQGNKAQVSTHDVYLDYRILLSRFCDTEIRASFRGNLLLLECMVSVEIPGVDPGGPVGNQNL